jgi:hypothetical protein
MRLATRSPFHRRGHRRDQPLLSCHGITPTSERRISMIPLSIDDGVEEKEKGGADIRYGHFHVLSTG